MSGGADEFQRQSRPVSVAGYAAFIFGAIGLAGAMMTDVIAVIGRHISAPFLGSVETAQIFVVLVGGASLVAATLGRDHATVRVLTDRLPAPARASLARFANIAAALFFLVLTVGSAWIMWDLRDGAERTELLAFPVVALRSFWLVCAVTCTLVFAARVFGRNRAS